VRDRGGALSAGALPSWTKCPPSPFPSPLQCEWGFLLVCSGETVGTLTNEIISVISTDFISHLIYMNVSLQKFKVFRGGFKSCPSGSKFDRKLFSCISKDIDVSQIFLNFF
jgi:hypothetical protein